MKLVVTGGTGFVGTNVALYFLAQGYDVVAIDNLFKEVGTFENRQRLLEAGARVEHVDIRNHNDVSLFFERNKDVDIVIHAAAQVAFKRSVANPRLDFEINALGTLNLLESVRLQTQDTLFINCSTNQVYGQLADVPIQEFQTRYDFVDLPHGISETHRLDFLSPYGCSKGAGDQYTLDYARIYGLKTVVTRFGGIYGDWQYSYEDHGWVAYITKMVLFDKAFNRFGHGKQVRDVLHVSDICRAFDMIIKHPENVLGQAINIAGGPQNTLSVLELLRLLESLTGNKEKSIVNDMRQGDKVVCYLDIRKAENTIGWKPLVDKEQGVARLIEWTRKHVDVSAI